MGFFIASRVNRTQTGTRAVQCAGPVGPASGTKLTSTEIRKRPKSPVLRGFFVSAKSTVLHPFLLTSPYFWCYSWCYLQFDSA